MSENHKDSVISSIVPALTGLVALLIGNGIGRLGYPPLIPALISNHWFNVSEAHYMSAGNLTGYIIGSAFASRINQRIPSVHLIKSALVLTAITFAACAVPFSFPIYFVLRLIAGFTGGIIMVVTAPTIMKSIPPKIRGVIGGIVFSGVGIGVVMAGTVIPFLLKIGLPVTWLFYAGLSLILTVVFWNGWPKGSNNTYMAEQTVRGSAKQSIWNRTVIILLIAYACNAVGFVPHTVFWVDFISRGLHLGIKQGTQLWILLGLSAAAGPILIGYLADKIGFSKSIRISLFIKGTGILLPVFSTAYWALAISSICVGSLALGISSLTVGRITELVLPESQKRVWSTMTVAFSITNAATAYLLSYVFSLTGSYNLIFEIGAVTLIGGSILDYWASLTPKIKAASMSNKIDMMTDC